MKTMRSQGECVRPARATALVLVAAVLCGGARADDKDTIVTDRPDFVESSNVVGKGRVQLETSVAVERDTVDGVRERTRSTPTLLRVGVSDSLELRLETDGRLWARTEDLAARTVKTEQGYADTAIGVKWHALDAQGGMPSIGVLAHLDLDTGTAAFRGNGRRPSLRVAAEWDLPAEMSLGLMPGVQIDKSDSGERSVSGILGVVLGKEWSEDFRSFVEVAAPRIARSKHGGTVATFDVGVAYTVSTSWQVDLAMSRGLNRRTPDLSWTLGVSVKY